MSNRPHTTVVLAMTADGKIADRQKSPARFGSSADKAHLEKQIALADGVLFGAGTLRAYGTTLSIGDRNLLQQREQEHKPPQPVHIVCSRSGQINAEIRFFQQSIPRWLLTTPDGAKFWQHRPEFEQILIAGTTEKGIDWMAAFAELTRLGLTRLAVLGGSELVASLLGFDLLDELWLTVCPLILGGREAPTPVGGVGLLPDVVPHLQLLSVETVQQEVFLHYRFIRQNE